MMAPRARTPNTSGIHLDSHVSDTAKPAPKTTSEASRAWRDGTHESASRDRAWSAKPARMVARGADRSDTAPDARRPPTEPRP